MKPWIMIAIVIPGLLACGYLFARTHNPTRPLIGEPTAKHYEFFARRFNNLMVARGELIEQYETDLRRTDSVTAPLVGEFVCMWGGRPVRLHFAWKDGRWVESSGAYQAVADEAQK